MDLTKGRTASKLPRINKQATNDLIKSTSISSCKITIHLEDSGKLKTILIVC